MKISKSQIYEFLDYLQFNKLYSQNTIRAYTNDLFDWLAYLESIHKDFKEFEITSLTYNWVMNSSNSKILKKSSISRKISAVKSFLNYLYKFKIIENKLALTLKIPKKDKLLPKYLNSSEVSDVINKNLSSDDLFAIRNSLIVLLFFNTGMRISELKSVKMDDINLDRNEIKIIGKGNKERIVFFTGLTGDFLKSYLSKRSKIKTENRYLFISRLKKGISERMIRYVVSNIWKEQTGKKITPHQLRHSLATYLLNQGVELKYIQEILGHESINTTNVYAKLSEKTLKKEYYRSLENLKSNI